MIHRLFHRPTFCLWCLIVAMIPLTHALEPYGLSVHGVESLLEQLAQALLPHLEEA